MQCNAPKKSDIFKCADRLKKIIKENKYTETEIRILIEANVITENKKRIDITLDENLINMMDVVSNNRSELISLATREYIKNNYMNIKYLNRGRKHHVQCIKREIRCYGV